MENSSWILAIHLNYSKKLLWEASPMSDGGNASQLQDRSMAGHGWADQPQWQHLWDNTVKGGTHPVQ